jgi:CobQ-like glutamine amidotransferase family enzyme
LLAEFYKPADGDPLPGLGHFRAHTVHPGTHVKRCVGNVVAKRGTGWLVGFENHGGRTTLNGSEPLAKIVVGHGNNGKDGFEGAVEGNAFGTYLHGSLLPKNPAFADHLITLAMSKRGYTKPLRPLDDSVEERAKQSILDRLNVKQHARA